jgi:anti-anti-sigma regulatory factor
VTGEGHLDLRTRTLSGCTVVHAAGMLDGTTYRQLRDALVKLAVEQPHAVIVDITDLGVSSETALTVFVAAWMRVSEWPGVPILLAVGSRWRQAVVRAAINRYIPHYPTVAEAVTATANPPRVRRAVLDLEVIAVASRLARAFVRDTCHDWVLPHLSPNAATVATELVDNVVLHARAPAQLRLELRARTLTVAVRDGSPQPAIFHERTHGDRGGNGIRIVDDLTKAWGCTPHLDGGKVVWGNLARR